MSSKITGLVLLGLLAVAPVSSSFAQDTLVPGANSFTEGQVRGRLEDAGYTDISGLQKDDKGVWRGRAVRNGSPTEVGVDFRGTVVAGAAGAPTEAPGSGSNNAVNVGPGNPNTPGANPNAGGADGTPGNPPGTAAGRALGTSPATPPAAAPAR